MSVNRFLFGDKDRLSQASLQTPEQQQHLSDIFGQLGPQGQIGQNFGLSQDYLRNMLSGSPEAYSMWAQPYQTQFQEQILPGIAERYSGMIGAHGNPANSSGFGQAIGGAASQFQSGLAGLYAQLQQQAAQSAMGQYGNFSNLGLGTRGFENIYQPGSTGALGGLVQGIGSGVGMAAGIPFGNATVGAASNFMSLFNRGAKT